MKQKNKIIVHMASFVILVLVTVLTIFVIINYRRLQLVNAQEELGIQAVKLLYDFGTPEQLDAQMASLKAITTEPVFNQLTIDNEERTLNTYLKFKNEPVTVNIVQSTNTYVMYSLGTVNVSADRLFIFLFTVNDEGLIDSVREVEAIDFINSYS